MSEPRKTILINPDFLKLPMRGNRTRKNNSDSNSAPKPIKIRSEKKSELDKTYKRRALNYIRKYQEEKHKRMMRGADDVVAPQIRGQSKTYTDEFQSDFDNSLDFLQKLTDQNKQKVQVHNATLKHHIPQPQTPTNSLLFETPFLNSVLENGIGNSNKHLVQNLMPPPFSLPNPTYGCLKNGMLPTYRTLKSHGGLGPLMTNNPQTNTLPPLDNINQNSSPQISSVTSQGGGGGTQRPPRLTPEQQRAELKQFLEKRKEEKERVQRVQRQRNLVNPAKKQKRTTTRTFRVGKSKHYPKVGVLIPNKTIRTQVLAKKQKIRETPLQDVRKYLIQKGLIRVGSSCPNDVLRQMYESSMMMCGEIQNHNPDNLLYNYLHNGL